MSHQKRDEGSEINNHEKWEAGDPGNMPGVRDEDVQNRQKLVRQFILPHGRAGYLLSSPSYIAHFKLMWPTL